MFDEGFDPAWAPDDEDNSWAGDPDDEDYESPDDLAFRYGDPKD